MKKLIVSILACLAISTSVFAQYSTMVLVEGGTFRMGDKNAEADAQTVHNVTLDSFYMDKYKVTLSDWIEIMGTRPCDYKNWGVWQNPLSSKQWNQIAAMGISWYEALIYCNRKSVLEGLEPCYSSDGSKDAITYALWNPDVSTQGYKTKCLYFPGVECDWEANGYRLPTEAEWEYAARGGKKNSSYKYSGSNDFTEVINLESPYKIGIKKANALNIFDMSMGPEWCWDLYKNDYYSSSPAINPHGPELGDNLEVYMSLIVDGKDTKNEQCRVLRGGEYERLADRQNENAAAAHTVYARSYNNPENYDRSGALATLFMFRLVRNEKDADKKKNLIIERDVEVKITGVPYFYFMTDDFDVLKIELASYMCRAPKSSELEENPNLSKAVINKMQELGCCWSITLSNSSAILNYYSEEEGAYSVSIFDLMAD